MTVRLLVSSYCQLPRNDDSVGLLNINSVPKIWASLPGTVQTKLLALMRKVSSLGCLVINDLLTISCSLDWPSQSTCPAMGKACPGCWCLLFCLIEMWRCGGLQLSCGAVLLTLTLSCLVQASEREPMAENMPETKLVLALHMSEELIHGTQEHLSHSNAARRCVLPIGFMEQVRSTCSMKNLTHVLMTYV